MRFLYSIIAIALMSFAVSRAAAQEEAYTLTDGRVLLGEPISYNDAGVVLQSAGAFLPRTPWTEFSQESLKRLAAQAKNPRDAAFVELHIEELVDARAKRAQITVSEVPKADFPEGRTGFLQMFTSPLGLVLLLLVYAANIYAGFEVANYRNRSAGQVCGISAVAPFIAPAVFLAMPTRRVALAPERGKAPHPDSPEHFLAAHEGDAEMAAAEAAEDENASADAGDAPKLPPTVTFARGDFTFNRRFFETKLPGFLRVVPGETEKNMVVVVKSTRGDFVGRRISNLSQSDIHLETFKGNATADELIPFVEIREVQVKHVDAP